MPGEWYRVAPGDAQLTQGELIFNCPVVSWNEAAQWNPEDPAGTLRAASEVAADDVVVMTQACDIEQRKVDNIILCPHYELAAYKTDWEGVMRENAQNPTAEAWRKECEGIKQGSRWGLSMLNPYATAGFAMTHRVVNFHQIFSVPRPFLENFISRAPSRLQLNPPYREYLSQAFARFFMRVGLPLEIERAW